MLIMKYKLFVFLFLALFLSCSKTESYQNGLFINGQSVLSLTSASYSKSGELYSFRFFEEDTTDYSIQSRKSTEPALVLYLKTGDKGFVTGKGLAEEKSLISVSINEFSFSNNVLKIQLTGNLSSGDPIRIVYSGYVIHYEVDV